MTKYITNWLFKVKGENTKNPFKTGLQNANQLTTGEKPDTIPLRRQTAINAVKEERTF